MPRVERRAEPVRAAPRAERAREEHRRELTFRFPRAVQVSASTEEGIDELNTAIEAQFLKTLRRMELLVPYAEGGSLSELHELAGELVRGAD